jgi:hypothetical protein
MPNTKPPLEERHDKWLATIRDVASTVITLEEERVPSFTALKLQWKRICWVSMLWMHSTSRNVYENLPMPAENGWILVNNEYHADSMGR